MNNCLTKKGIKTSLTCFSCLGLDFLPCYECFSGLLEHYFSARYFLDIACIPVQKFFSCFIT